MFIEYKETTIFYTDNGQGKAVVLLHGFLENSAMWKPFIPPLSIKNRVITIDLLGHGKTGCLGYIHTMELMAEAVNAVLTHLNIKDITIIGHSMGGYVALAFAEKKPSIIKGLCLMNSTANGDSLEKKANRDRAVLTVKRNHKTFIRIAISNLFNQKNRTLFSEDIEKIIEQAQKTPLQGIIAALEGMKIRKDRQILFKNANYKKLLIASIEDPVLNYKFLVSQTKNTDIEVVSLPDGHMSYIENKNEFLLKIMLFIEKL